MAELKDCPFCGDPVGIMKGQFKITTWIIDCTNCGLRMYDNSKEKLIDTWNMRAPEKKKNSRFTPDLSFIENDDWKELYKEWVDNKKSPFKKQIGVKKGFAELFNMSHYDIETAQDIVDKSLANNWSGLFEIKNNYKPEAIPEKDNRTAFERLEEKYGR